jgi:hypothetical protein
MTEYLVFTGLRGDWSIGTADNPLYSLSLLFTTTLRRIFSTAPQ